MSDEDPLYIEGFPNVDRMGFIPLRSSRGAPDEQEIAKAAKQFGEPSRCIDPQGYECEICGAAVEGGAGYAAFVRCRAKEVRNGFVDIEFRIHLLAPDGKCESWPIETYNPYFGCDVGFMKWIGGSCILVYREKHHTYAWRIAPQTPAMWVKIEDDWIIRDDILAFIEDEGKTVSRVKLPEFEELEPISADQARATGWHPCPT
jgi:hypothetical protein